MRLQREPTRLLRAIPTGLTLSQLDKFQPVIGFRGVSAFLSNV
jgi:hypothetical protein